MRTMLEAFKDEVGFPVSEGYLRNRLLARGISPEDECLPDVFTSKSFLGAVADTLLGLVRMPNIQEGDMRIDLTNRGLLVEQANAIYKSIGEPAVSEKDKPKASVKIGWG